jgi:hypothetical protein
VHSTLKVLYSAQHTKGTVQCTAHSRYCTMHSTLKVPYSAQHTKGTVQCTAHSRYCTMHSTLTVLYNAQRHAVPYTLTHQKAHLFLTALWLLPLSVSSPSHCSHPSLSALFNHQQTQKTQQYLFPPSSCPRHALLDNGLPACLPLVHSVKQEMCSAAQWRHSCV